MVAARTGSADVVRRLIAKGADVNAKERHARPDRSDVGRIAATRPTLSRSCSNIGADVRARSNVWTEVVKNTRDTANAGRLCQPRADCYIVEIQQGGYTPLLFAARVGDLASAKLLVAARADVNDVAPYGTSATTVAAHSGHGELAAFLLERGADPNAAGAGYTALHAAILHKDANLVGALLAHGAKPNTPLLSASPTRRDSVDFYFHPSFVGASPFWLAARFKARGDHAAAGGSWCRSAVRAQPDELGRPTEFWQPVSGRGGQHDAGDGRRRNGRAKAAHCGGSRSAESRKTPVSPGRSPIRSRSRP